MTNPVLQAIKTRRSIRSYQDRQITREELEAVVDAGLWAASGNNLQSWRITAVQSPQRLQEVNRTIRDCLRTIPVTADTNAYFTRLIQQAAEDGVPDYLFGAPSYLIVSNSRDNDNAMADSALVVGNIMLAAHSLGLGTCWLNLLPRMKEFDEVRALMDALEIPGDHLIYGTVSLGYPAEEAAPPERKPGTVRYF